MKDFAQILLGFCIVVTVAFVLLIGGGALVTWYVETRFGVDAVASAVRWIGFAFAFLAAATVIFVGWWFAQRSHAAATQSAVNVMSQSVDAYGAGFEYLVAGQKALAAAASADSYTAKAIAAQAKADADIRVMEYRHQLESEKRAALPAPAEAQPVRRAPWERALPAPEDEAQDVATEARFRRMY